MRKHSDTQEPAQVASRQKIFIAVTDVLRPCVQRVKSTFDFDFYVHYPAASAKARRPDSLIPDGLVRRWSRPRRDGRQREDEHYLNLSAQWRGVATKCRYKRLRDAVRDNDQILRSYIAFGREVLGVESASVRTRTIASERGVALAVFTSGHRRATHTQLCVANDFSLLLLAIS